MDARHDIPRYLVVGANHRSSTNATRDRLFVEDAQAIALLQRLRDAGLDQALLLSTCARTEVQAAHVNPGEAALVVTRALAEQSGLKESEIAAQLYIHEDQAAVGHVFAVAAALDSPVIGEPQVSGQIRDSHRASVAAGMAGRELEALLQAAYGVAKRVRTETSIGERPVSMAAVALQLARDVHGELSRCTGLLNLGGEMGELVVEQLIASGLQQMTVMSPVAARAEAVARRFGCHHASSDRMDEFLASSEIVISSVGGGEHTISVDQMRQALGIRKRRPVFLIDVAVPGDVEPEVNELDGAFLYDLDDLERIAATARADRGAAAVDAREIIDEEVALFSRRNAARVADPTLIALRAHFENIRQSVLAESRGRDADEVTRRLVNRLLHDPSIGLKDISGDGDYIECERLLRRLFGLDDDPISKGPTATRDKQT
jgi:glutamyl-tRNA reductase